MKTVQVYQTDVDTVADAWSALSTFILAGCGPCEDVLKQVGGGPKLLERLGRLETRLRKLTPRT